MEQPVRVVHDGRGASPPPPKSVAFELVFPESPQYRARLPMRVQIYLHDTTDSIVTTVKNFYGLYSGPNGSPGISFEDEQGNTLIARYENFRDNMTVYVRVTGENGAPTGAFGANQYPVAVGAQSFYTDDTSNHLLAPHQADGHHISRPTSRTSRNRSLSPGGRGRRSASAGTNPNSRSRSVKKRGPGSLNNGDNQSDAMNGYSSGDNAPGSASHLGNTEISVENIVEGGRRKRAKFESSELPLFAPPQMPAAASNSSVSPARRNDHRQSFSFIPPGTNHMTNSRPLQSPSSYNSTHGASGLYATPAADARRGRASTGGNFGGAPRVWPTPEPTIGSALSEEDKDVVMQLMRLGDVSNFSYGRTPASTHDETLSGRAEMASSTGATSSDCESESEDEEPPAKQQKTAHHASYEAAEGRFAPPANGNGTAGSANYNTAPAAGGRPKLKANTLVGPGSRDYAVPGVPKAAKSANKPKVSRAGANGKSKKANGPGVLGPMSPPSLPASRKPSVGASNGGAALALGDEETADLSTKPRCQRCRKSKKGCDRQRPCGRCKDAGIPADQCISEDEGNGRKGRYGRHMGVPIPKAMTASQASTTATTAAKTAADAPAEAHASANAHDHHGHAAGSAPSAPISTSFIPPPVPRTLLPPAPIAQASMAAPSAIAMDKSKKRKR